VGRMATQALTNLTTTGIRSAIINVGVQWYVKGSLSAVDIFDVTVSAFSGNAWFKAGIVQGLFDITSQEITNPFEKGLNKLAVDVVTQTLFNGANFGASAPLKIGPNSIYAFGVDGAFQLWGEIWNYQLNQIPSTKR
ncbi:MAG: hypothetical protein JNL53_09065, partial [Cyclobacteriaceae bacterium]|nr:hypothetical protein [Cyclobacteriaceae bacterium]